MKIVAQSIVPTKPTYIHIAYGAATTMQNEHAGFLVILAGLCVLYYQLRRKMQTYILLSTVICAALLAYFFFAFSPFKETYRHPSSVSQGKALFLFEGIAVRSSKGQQIPSTVREMMRKWNLKEQAIQDAWNHDLRVYHRKDGYQVVSAGQDGKFGTQDDIAYPRTEDVAMYNTYFAKKKK